MKKITGILGVAMIVATMFFNSNAVNSFSPDTTLTSLMTINSANAECAVSGGGGCSTSNRNCYIVIGDRTITCYNSSPYLR